MRFKLFKKNRWADINNIHKTWESRMNLIVKHIENANSVLEFGAARLYLKTLLPSKVKYTNSDLYKRDKNTIVCDLNKPPYPKFDYNDYIIFSGVLEYVNDVPFLLRVLSENTSNIIFSYSVTDYSQNSNYEYRQRSQWVNNYTIRDLAEIAKKINFQFEHTNDWVFDQNGTVTMKQGIFVMKKL